ncbi:MAG: ParB/RepB/Spo0J family partition protein [Acidobacteriota bacterium]|nr:ParB/RepB/Spo0J family partition protein [Acidobacteriota bacterium]
MSKPPDTPRKVLGKGLSALLPARSSNKAISDSPPPAPEVPSLANLSKLMVDQIDPNPLQPRSVFDLTKLGELAASIQANGIIQPLIVRRKGDRFELVAGERRFRAAQEAGLAEVPVVVQEYADNQLLEIALIENIQREDLNPIETAQALDRLMREGKLSHEEIGRRTGKDRTTITNLLRLLKLPPEVQLLVAERRLSMGHARAILGLAAVADQITLAEQAANKGYSVREVERFIQSRTEQQPPAGPKLNKAQLGQVDPNTAAAVAELESALGTRVRIVPKTDQRGRIEIEYYSQEELNRLYEHLISAART